MATALDNYAALLSDMKRDAQAAVMKTRAEKFRKARRGGPGSTYLGFDVAATLREYAVLLRVENQGADAKEMRALADAYHREQIEHFLRLQRT